METQISTLLKLTYSGQDDEEIKNAQNELFEGLAHEEFFQSLFNIIANPSEVRRSAIIFLNNSIRSFWDQENTPFNEQIRHNIFLFIPQLLKILTNEISKLCSHLSTDVIYRVYLTNEWQDLYNEIMSGLSSQKDNQILSSLILSDSLFIASIQINKENEEEDNESLKNANQNLIQFISEHLLQFILNIFQEKSTNLQHLIKCYQIVNHILKFNDRIIQQILSVNDILMSLAQEMIQYSFQVKEVPSDNPHFQPFLKKIIKFLTTCITNPLLTNLINIEYINYFLSMIQEILKASMPNPIKCNTLRFLKEILANDETWQAVDETNLSKTLSDMILPLFSVSPEDLEMAYNDPTGFISENQKICEDFNDLKASASSILYKSAKKHNVLLSICLSSVGEVYQMFENGQADQLNLFAIFHMCSSIIGLAVEKDNDAVLSLFGNISSLFQITEDEDKQLATSGAFLLLASCTNLNYSKELVQVVFLNVDNPFNLTRFFALECISSILRQLSKNPKLSEMKEQIFAEYSEKLEQSLQLLLNISREVSNENLIEPFTHLFPLFGEKLLPHAQDLTDNFLNMIQDITSNIKSDDFELKLNLIAIIESFSTLLKIIVKSKEAAAQLCPTIYDFLLQLLPSMPSIAVSSYFTLFNQIVFESPTFNSAYWNITNYFDSDNAAEFNHLLELIQFKETDMSNDESAMQIILAFISGVLNEINEYDDFQDYFPSITGFVLRMRKKVIELNDGVVFGSIVQKIVPFIQFLNSEDSSENPERSNSNIVRLLNALIIADDNLNCLMEICGDDFPLIIVYWEQRLIYPLSVPAAINVIKSSFLDNEQKSILLSSVLNLACKNLANDSNQANSENSEDDDSDDFDDVDDVVNAAEDCPWFTDNEVVSMLSKIFADKSNEALFEKCIPDQIEFLANQNNPT